jgi:hypothetical protein
MALPLVEALTYDQAGIRTQLIENATGGKDLYMEGIFIQGGVRNQNQRVYPVSEISRACNAIAEKIKGGYSVLGEADHPDDLQVNLDRVSHMITNMYMNENNGIGKLKILPTPMGNIVKTLLESNCKLGVSSRGSGNVDGSGGVTDFEIVTVDIVAQPSAPSAYPKAIYERVMNDRRRSQLWGVAEATRYDDKAQKYLKEEVLRFINNLKK